MLELLKYPPTIYPPSFVANIEFIRCPAVEVAFIAVGLLLYSNLLNFITIPSSS